MNKKFIVSATLATATIAGSMYATPTEAATFNDVKPADTYHKAIMEYAKRGLISGYADQTFKPELDMTRGQFVQILARVLNVSTNSTATYFSDMDSKNAFNGAAVAIADAGIDISYADGSFRPRASITKIEAARMLAQAYALKSVKGGSYRDVALQDVDTVNAIIEMGIMTAPVKYYFKGEQVLTRGAAVQAMYVAEQTMKKQQDIEWTLQDIKLGKVITDDDTSYAVTQQLKSIFSATNKKALQDALVKVRVQNGTIVEIISVQLNTDNATFNAKGKTIPTVIVNANNVKLQDVVMTKQLTVTDEAEDKLTLENIRTNGQIHVEDGYGALALELKNTAPKAITMQRDSVTLKSNKPLAKLVLDENVYDITLHSKIKQLDVLDDLYVDMYGTPTIDKLTLAKGSDLDLRYTGVVKQLHIADPRSSVYLRSGARIGKVSVPRNADYTDIFSPYAYIATNIEQISTVGSAANLIAPQKPVVINPFTETYEQALARAIVGFNGSAVKDQLFLYTTFGTFNEVRLYGAKMDASIKATAGLEGLSNDTEFDLHIKRNGQVLESKKLKVGALRSGVRLSAITGSTLGELLSHKGRAQDQWTIEFVGLQQAMTTELQLLVNNKIVRNTTVAVPGKLTEQSVMTAAFKNYTAKIPADTTNVFTLETQFGQIYAEYLAGKRVDYLLKLNGAITGATDATTYTALVKRNGSAFAAQKVTVAELKQGKLLSNLVGENAKDITSFANNASDVWEVELVELQGKAKLDTSLLVEGQTYKKAQIEVAGKPAPTNFTEAAKAAIAKFDATAVQNKLTVQTIFSQLFDTEKLGDATLDAKLTITNGLATLPDDGTYTITIKQGTLNKTVTVTAQQLKAAGSIQLSTLLGGAGKLVDHTKGTTDDWTIDIAGLQHSVDAKLQLVATKGNDVVELGTKNVTISPAADVLTVMQRAISSFDVSATQHTAIIKTTFGTIDATKLANAKLDARVKVTTPLPEKKYALKITFDGSELMVKEVAASQLTAGIKLSEILGQPAANLVGHSGVDEWKIEALNLADEANIAVDLLINNTVIQSKKEIVVKQNDAYIALKNKAITTFELPQKVADNRFNVQTTFAALTAAEKQQLYDTTIDTMVTLKNGFVGEDAKFVGLKIQYKNATPVTKYVKIADLRAGKQLSAILEGTPALLAAHSGTDDWTIEVLNRADAVAAKPAALAVTDITALSKEATIALQFLVDGQLFGEEKQLSLGLKFKAITDAINSFTVGQHNNIFTINTVFGSIRKEDLTAAEVIDARVSATAANTALLQQTDYIVDIVFNGEVVAKDKVIAKAALIANGVKLSSLIGDAGLLKDQVSTKMDTWQLVVKNLDAQGVIFKFDLLVGDQVVKTANQIVRDVAYTSAIERFTAESNADNQLAVTTKFTDMSATTAAEKANTIDAKLTVANGANKSYKVKVSLNNQVLTATQNITLDANGAILLSDILAGAGTLGSHASKEDKWVIEIVNPATAEKIATTVDLVIGGNVVRTITPVPLQLKPK